MSKWFAMCHYCDRVFIDEIDKRLNAIRARDEHEKDCPAREKERVNNATP